MKASYNYTGRKRLDDSTFELNIRENTAAPADLEISLNTEEIENIPETAVAWVEAYHSSKMMRFCLGGWAEVAQKKFALTDFDPGEPLLFRIKIVEESDEKHPIKGWREQIRPVIYDASGRQKKSILPVYPTDLGSCAWKIDWSEPSRPILKVNSRINSIANIVAKDPDFAALVFPQVIREVLTRLLHADIEDEENEWLTFAESLVADVCERDEDDEEDERLIDAWVERVIQRFGQEADVITRYNNLKEGK